VENPQNKSIVKLNEYKSMTCIKKILNDHTFKMPQFIVEKNLTSASLSK
jgi:hypothetical protein